MPGGEPTAAPVYPRLRGVDSLIFKGFWAVGGLFLLVFNARLVECEQ